MNEKWKAIIGYEGRYVVSNTGRIKSLVTGKFLKQNPDSYGHLGVNLYSGSRESVKKRYVHVMVAEAFIGSRPKGKQVCHGKLGIKVNSASNLSYGSPSKNGLDRRRDGTAGRRVIRSDGVVFHNANFAAETMGVAHSAIYAVCKGERNSAYGFTWEYVDA